MDDLNGLEWSASSKPSVNKASAGTGNYYPTLRPTPSPQNSGRNTPLSAQGYAAPKATPFAPPKSATPDSFSNLVSFGSSKKSTLTLQEQQEKLEADRRKKEEEKKRQYQAQFGASQFWDGLENKGHPQVLTPPIASRVATPASIPTPSNFARASSPAVKSSTPLNGAEDDLFAAFNSDTKVDNSSYYPPPSIPSNGANTPDFVGSQTVGLNKPQAWEQSGPLGDFGDDDDPFGLGQMKAPTSVPAPIPSVDDDDDFLGDLGKPVEEVRRPTPPKQEAARESDFEPESDDPWDKAVAELVDMGFSAEQSRRALTEGGAGTIDVQAAVGWILNDAHNQAKKKQQGRDTSSNKAPSSNGNRREVSRDNQRTENVPAWMREDSRDRSQPQRQESRSPANGETDLSKAAAQVGSNFLKSANSFFKTSTKKVQKAVAEFQQDSDLSQPKWMREAAEREQAERTTAVDARNRRQQAPEVTDEALMLEGGGRPPPRKSKAPEQRFPTSSSSYSRNQSPSMPKPPPARSTPVPRWQQTTPGDPRSRITKQAIEEQSAQAYISPARRKKTTPQPQAAPEPDLLFSSSEPKQVSRTISPAISSPTPRVTPNPSKPSTPIPTRPKALPRNIPHLSSIALQSSNQHRLAGTSHFKRGDYASAHQSYTSSLSSLPESHPITVILFCNRALTSLKTGIPRDAVSDADNALNLIGPSRGDDETIDLGPGEGGGKKEMKEFWGKALMRKAEALEQMEKWKEAGEVWKACVEGGVGGATAIQGRTRCEKALAPKPVAPTRTVTPRSRPKPKASALSDLGPSAPDSEAVGRLRAANKAAEKADDEKFALADQVDAKISAWRDGKRDNLRGLIGSLDMVMWEGSGWKKIGMQDLITNGKVKINYMKAIGKCHPDKLPQDASTEVKLIAATVFSTLNESWDKFKTANGM